jgi:dTDP-4-dehydrorhamnose reductase
MIFQEAGKDAEVVPVSSTEYQTLAKRPAYSVLDNKALRERHGYIMKDWKEAFREYMREYESR